MIGLFKINRIDLRERHKLLNLRMLIGLGLQSF
jgi:hypothetical protein